MHPIDFWRESLVIFENNQRSVNGGRRRESQRERERERDGKKEFGLTSLIRFFFGGEVEFIPNSQLRKLFFFFFFGLILFGFCV